MDSVALILHSLRCDVQDVVSLPANGSGACFTPVVGNDMLQAEDTLQESSDSGDAGVA
jgi:hypothetical protein